MISDVLADAGAVGWVHARTIGGHADERGWRPDEPVPMASLYKLVVAAAWAREVTEGRLVATEPMRLRAADRVAGPTGVATMLDDVVLTARDAVRLMLTVSDNAIGDVLLAQVGHASVRCALLDAGATATVVRRGSGAAQRALERETGTSDHAASMRALADLDRDVVTSEYDPALAGATCARDMTGFLATMWGDSSEAMSLVRSAMQQQAWRHRIGAGFPHDDVVLAAKSGTLGTLRHEVAVVQFPDEVPVAVAVLTRSVRAERHLPALDAAIGQVAREVVSPLRRPR